MTSKTAYYRPSLAVLLPLLASGCGPAPTDTNPEPVFSALSANGPASVECPWVDGERGRSAVVLPEASGHPPVQIANFVPGCAILRFTVTPDGRVASAALRAAAPLNDGPTALAALQLMRFQPARSPDALFIVRLSMHRDDLGHIAVTPDTPYGSSRFFGLL